MNDPIIVFKSRAVGPSTYLYKLIGQLNEGKIMAKKSEPKSAEKTPPARARHTVAVRPGGSRVIGERARAADPATDQPVTHQEADGHVATD